MIPFEQFLADKLQATGFSTADTLASFLPLARQVSQAHDAGLVAPLVGLADLHVEGATIWFPEDRRSAPAINRGALRLGQQVSSRAIDVVSESRASTNLDDDADDDERVRLEIGQRGTDITRPVYLLGYVAWEHQLDHHDPLTDIFSLGLILASLACRLDFREADDLERFVADRANLFRINAELHPVLAQAIVRMTELDPSRRPADLSPVIKSLENYRDQTVDIDIDLAREPDFAAKNRHDKQQVVLSKLQQRLFEISRRNRLLHFRPTMQTVNLTHASVPLSFNVEHIRPEEILTWSESFSASWPPASRFR